MTKHSTKASTVDRPSRKMRAATALSAMHTPSVALGSCHERSACAVGGAEVLVLYKGALSSGARAAPNQTFSEIGSAAALSLSMDTHSPQPGKQIRVCAPQSAPWRTPPRPARFARSAPRAAAAPAWPAAQPLGWRCPAWRAGWAMRTREGQVGSLCCPFSVAVFGREAVLGEPTSMAVRGTTGAHGSAAAPSFPSGPACCHALTVSRDSFSGSMPGGSCCMGAGRPAGKHACGGGISTGRNGIKAGGAAAL